MTVKELPLWFSKTDVWQKWPWKHLNEKRTTRMGTWNCILFIAFEYIFYYNRTGYSLKTVVPKSFMAITRIESELGGANRHQSSVGKVSGLASCQVWEAGSGHCGESSKHLRKFKVGTLNVNTLRGRVCEVVETLSLRKVNVCCIQETRYSTVVATAAQSRVRTPSTSSTGQETTKALLV